jgi:hypothetical protein
MSNFQTSRVNINHTLRAAGVVMVVAIQHREILMNCVSYVFCGLTGKCNSELLEIGRGFSNDRFFGKLSRDLGKIRYYGTDRKTGSKIDTQGCSFVCQSERQYVCKANHADATYNITIEILTQTI